MFNQILVTENKYSENYSIGGVIDGSKAGRIKEYQTVVAVGPLVEERGTVKVGDVVFVNPKRYMKMQHQFGDPNKNNIQQDNMHAIFDIPEFEVYDRKTKEYTKYLLIGDNDIYFIAEGDDLKDDTSGVKPLVIPHSSVVIE